MKRKFSSIILLLLFVFSLVSCGEYELPNRTSIPSNTSTPSNASTNTTSTSTLPNDNGEVEFTVSLTFKGIVASQIVDGKDVYVILVNRTRSYKALVENGIATINALDGEYYVHLDLGSLKNYSYDPNGTIVNTSNPTATIELFQLKSIPRKNQSRGQVGGKQNQLINNILDFNDPANDGKTIYIYSAVIDGSEKEVYYQFDAKNNGTFIIESLVDIYDDQVNPYMNLYTFGPSTGVKNLEAKIDEGGSYLKGGFTKNFKYTVDVSERKIGNSFTFGIKVNTRDSVEYPVTVNFKIQYVSPYSEELIYKNPVYASDLYAKRDADGNVIYKKDSSGNETIYKTNEDGSNVTKTYVDENGTTVTRNYKDYELNYVKINSADDLRYSIDYPETHNTIWWNSHLGVDALPNIYSDVEYNSAYYYKTRYKYDNGNYVEDVNGDYILAPSVNVEEGNGRNYHELASYSLLKDGDNQVLISKKGEYFLVYYNENDGFYHVRVNNYDTILYVPITSSIPLMSTLYGDTSFNFIEDQGDGNRTISYVGIKKNTIILNYKRFIEAEYADFCNDDGRCYVTMEMKEFLLNVSNGKGYFYDGNGTFEADSGVYATDEDQWLFACGFYM